MFAIIFRTKAIPTEWISAYTPTTEEKSAAVDDEFFKNKIFITMDERSKLTTEWRFQKPKLGSYLISALTEASTLHQSMKSIALHRLRRYMQCE